MINRSDQPTMYRFTGTDKTYGPRPLDWVAATYGGNTNVSAAAEESCAEPDAWRPLALWVAALPTAPASTAQLERLAQLGSQGASELTYSAAARLIAEAEAARREARDRRPPTALKIKRLAKLGIALPPNATRAQVDRLLRNHELAERGTALSAAGLTLPREGVTDDNIDALEGAVDSLRFGLDQARERGVTFRPNYPLTVDAMNDLAKVLDEFWSLAGNLDLFWAGLVDSGDLPRVPTRKQTQAVLPILLEEIVATRWTDNDSSYVALGLRALAPHAGAS